MKSAAETVDEKNPASSVLAHLGGKVINQEVNFTMSEFGFVYVMGNDSMPGLYKIGYTTRSPLQRARELGAATSVPTKFSVLMYAETGQCCTVEKCVHSFLSSKRVSDNREFFKLSADDIKDVAAILKDAGETLVLRFPYHELLWIAEKEVEHA